MAMSTLRCSRISLGLPASSHKLQIGSSQKPVSGFVKCSVFGAPRWGSGGSHFTLGPATATGTELKWKRVTGTPGPSPSPSPSSCRSLIRAMAMTPGPGSVELAGALFTFATAFVMPLYTIMIVAPKWEWTKRAVESNFPYVVLGALYVYLFALSFTPETLPLMFSSKYWLPELPGITRMFSSTMTVASAWVHLLAADLFAGRQIYLDGLSSGVETRHSLILCLMMCPIGIFCHIMTKSVTLFLRSTSRGIDEQLTA